MKAAEFFQFWRGSSMCMFELFQQMRTNTDDGHVHKLELGGSSCPFSQTSVVAMQCVLWKGQVWDSERIFQRLACFQCTLLLYYSSIFQLRASDISSRGCRNSFHSSGKGKPREATIQCGRRTGWTGCSILRLLHEKLVLNEYRSLMIVDHCYSLSYSPLWLRYFVQEKESNHMVQIFALQVPLPWICCRSFLLLLKVCARQISCTTQSVQIRGTFDNLAWARVLFSRNFQIFPAFVLEPPTGQHWTTVPGSQGFASAQSKRVSLAWDRWPCDLRILLISFDYILMCVCCCCHICWEQQQQQRFFNGMLLSSSVDFGRYAILQLRNEVAECVRVTVEIKLLCPRVNALRKHICQLLWFARICLTWESCMRSRASSFNVLPNTRNHQPVRWDRIEI